MRFRVKAIRGMNDVAMFGVDAGSAQEASDYARRRGYDVIEVRRDHALAAGSASARRAFPVMHFSRELITLLKAGLTLVEAIEILHRKEERSAHKSLLAELLGRLKQGMKFSAALETFPAVFSPLYVATIRAAERTAGIKDALARYVDYRLQIDKVRSKVVSASIYPALLLCVGGLVTLFLLGYVVPRFSRIYEGMGEKLPLISQWLMQAGQIVDRRGGFVLAGVLGLGALAYYAFAHSEVRSYVLQWVFRLPGVRQHRRTYELAQFYRTVSMLLRSGLPVLPALDQARGLLSPDLQQNLERAALEVQEGKAFSEAMERHQLTTTVAYSMIVVAERSGSLSEMLDVVAAFHEEEIARFIDGFTRLFEPLLMAAIGIVIGLIVVFMYMPVFELAEAIG